MIDTSPNRPEMPASNMNSVPHLTFVSISGPTLDRASAKAMRAHTTRANFARRRRRLVLEYDGGKKNPTRAEPLEVEKHGLDEERGLGLQVGFPMLSHPGLDQQLNRKDAFFINYITQAMEKLHLVTDTPESGTAFAMIQSDWARFLPDPVMLDVSLYFARHVYAARQHRSVQFILDTYKGKAIQSVRERLDHGSEGVTDSLVAAIMILTVLDQGLGNVEAWKIHISGLLHVITVRSHNLRDAADDWISTAVPRTAMQGLLLLARHDATVLNTVERTGMFDTMLSAPAKKSAYLILENAQQVTVLQQRYGPNKKLDLGEQSRLGHIIDSLDTAIQLDHFTHPRESFLTAIALSIKVFLEIVLRSTTDPKHSAGDTAVQLMEVFRRPELQLPSSLALCSSLESLFWQTIMAVIAAPDDRTKSFFTSRLDKITVALALTSWHDSLVILKRYFWIPSLFSGPGYHIMSEILRSHGHIDV